MYSLTLISFSNGQENLAQCKEASLRIAVRGTETRLLLSSKYRNPQDMSYREIGGQKDYAVFGHCVIQCP